MKPWQLWRRETNQRYFNILTHVLKLAGVVKCCVSAQEVSPCANCASHRLGCCLQVSVPSQMPGCQSGRLMDAGSFVCKAAPWLGITENPLKLTHNLHVRLRRWNFIAKWTPTMNTSKQVWAEKERLISLEIRITSTATGRWLSAAFTEVLRRRVSAQTDTELLEMSGVDTHRLKVPFSVNTWNIYTCAVFPTAVQGRGLHTVHSPQPSIIQLL